MHKTIVETYYLFIILNNRFCVNKNKKTSQKQDKKVHIKIKKTLLNKEIMGIYRKKVIKKEALKKRQIG